MQQLCSNAEHNNTVAANDEDRGTVLFGNLADQGVYLDPGFKCYHFFGHGGLPIVFVDGGRSVHRSKVVLVHRWLHVERPMRLPLLLAAWRGSLVLGACRGSADVCSAFGLGLPFEGRTHL